MWYYWVLIVMGLLIVTILAVRVLKSCRSAPTLGGSGGVMARLKAVPAFLMGRAPRRPTGTAVGLSTLPASMFTVHE